MCRSSAILFSTPGTDNWLLGSFIFLATIVHLLIFTQLPRMLPNVRRYVALAQSRGGACFCTRGAMQGYNGYCFILALAKTVTPAEGPRREPGQAAPPTTYLSSLAGKFSRCGKPMTYTDLLCSVDFISIQYTCLIFL